MRPAWLEINTTHLRHNLDRLRQMSGQSRVIAVVKANAYGHGAVGLAPYLHQAGVWGLAVATVDEGRELRQAGVQRPILLLGSLHPQQAAEVIEAGLIPTLSTREAALALGQAAVEAGEQVGVHLKVETGMNRVGVPWNQALEFAHWLEGLAGVRLEGVYSHLASADEDSGFTLLQLQRFGQLRQQLGGSYLYHLNNSAGSLEFPAGAHEAIRCGIALYGLVPQANLKPIARLLARPTLVKYLEAGQGVGYGQTYQVEQPQWIATLPLGYADGLPRSLSNRGVVRWRGQLCPIVGRVSMDQITVRVPQEVGLEEVFEVVSADFDPQTSLWGWAQQTGTIAYEMAVRLAPRLARVYL